MKIFNIVNNPKTKAFAECFTENSVILGQISESSEEEIIGVHANFSKIQIKTGMSRPKKYAKRLSEPNDFSVIIE
jgi:hypothetical protein